MNFIKIENLDWQTQIFSWTHLKCEKTCLMVSMFFDVLDDVLSMLQMDLR